MDSYTDLEAILTDIAQDVHSTSQGGAGRKAFRAYRDRLGPLVRPYVRDGFLDEQRSLARFLSETATLHLTVSLVPHLCPLHDVGSAEGFWDINPDARLFSWYRVPKELSLRIRSWAVARTNLDEVVQAVALAAEDSLTGLRRRALGEFFTPTGVAQHLVALAEYDPLTISSRKIIDPACGSGNLLAAVVAKLVHAVQAGALDPGTAISGMKSNICGFDIQPVAAVLTRLQLLLASLPILERAGWSEGNVYEALSFPHVYSRDPLSNPEHHWEPSGSFDYILGNPPFLKLTKNRLPFLKHYEEVVGGQPNLYQLFLWWAIRATRADGRVVFLLPQSIRSGQYLSKLRGAIARCCELTAVTAFVDGTRVFDSVDQRMMIVALRKRDAEPGRPDVTIRVVADRQSVKHSPASSAGQDEVVWTQDNAVVWCVSEEPADYAIMEKVCDGQTALGSIAEFKVLNGGFVWNQHKDRLAPTEAEDTLPLLSSASIGVHQFTFPPSDERVSQRLFVNATPPVSEPVHAGVAILLKRTTPKKTRGRRIVGATLPHHFLAKHPSYFAENHVNLVCSTRAEVAEDHLLGLCVWLNTRLANFVFGMMNGSSHLSKFELQLIPTPPSLLTELGDLAGDLPTAPAGKRGEILARLDRHVYGFFHLSPVECKRVAQVVPLTM